MIVFFFEIMYNFFLINLLSMRIPIVNNFTCSYKQLNSFIKNIKNMNMITILDYDNENYTDFK